MSEQLAPVTRLEDVAPLPLIQDSHDLWDTLLGEAGMRASHRMLRFNQSALAMDAAADGQGVALAPRLLIEAELARGRLVEVWRDTRPDRRVFHLVCLQRPTPHPARTAVIDWILSEVDHARPPGVAPAD